VSSIPSPPSRERRTTPGLSDRGLAWWLRRGFRGFNTLHRWRIRCGGSARLLRQTNYGSIFALDPFSYIDAIVLREGYYESEVFEALRPFLGAGAVFWDIGGNIGLHSITAGYLHPTTKIFSFEPNPAMIAQIEANARLTGVEVSIMPYALAESGGPRTFHVNTQGNPGMSSLHAPEGTSFDRQITVQCERADDLVARGLLPPPTVIKLDVEGGEIAVLAGMGALLASPQLRAIVFEGGPGLENSTVEDPVANPLRAAGFRLKPLVRRERSGHLLENYLAARI
jgi:FkbM family methyltransferase